MQHHTFKMFQFKKENEADCRTNPEDSEGLEIEINDAAAAAVISDDAADDHADGVNEVPSMSPSSKKKKKKYGGLAKATMIVLACSAAAIGIGAAASKATNRASTDLQLAMNQAQADSMTSYSKSGKGCKDEVQVCVVDPITDIINWLGYIITGGPFTVPDEDLPDVKDFSKYLKKYNRNCTDFWANVFYVIQYVIVSIINSLCDNGKRALTASAAVIAPATRALNEVSAFVTGLIPKECSGLLTGLLGLVAGEVCIEEIADNITGLESAIDTCVDADWSGMDMAVMQEAVTIWMDGMMGTVDTATICRTD